MLPDPKWLEALKLPLRVTLAVALASSVLLALEMTGVLAVGPLQPLARPVLIIIAVVSVALSVVSIGHALSAPLRESQRQALLSARRAAKRQETEEAYAARQAELLKQLDTLSAEEIHYVGDCLRRGTPSFYTYVNAPPVSMLQGKGLVWTPGGSHHQDHYPFSFHSWAWDALVARKDEFIAKDDAAKAAKREQEERDRRRGIRGY